MLEAETRVPIESENDIVFARQMGRELAALVGFARTDQTLIATAISEVSRNILVYAKRGEVVLSALRRYRHGCEVKGILVIARDDGPGIADPELAMRDGYSTTGSLGVGLPGAKRLMDEFELVTVPGKGTTITMKKWI